MLCQPVADPSSLGLLLYLFILLLRATMSILITSRFWWPCNTSQSSQCKRSWSFINPKITHLVVIISLWPLWWIWWKCARIKAYNIIPRHSRLPSSCQGLQNTVLIVVGHQWWHKVDTEENGSQTLLGVLCVAFYRIGCCRLHRGNTEEEGKWLSGCTRHS